MVSYIIRRLLQMALVLLGVTVLLFVIMKLAPGDPARIMAGMRGTPEVIEAIRHKLGLDRPLHVQYWRFLTELLAGKLESMTFHMPVKDLILQRLPATIELGFAGFLLAVIVSIPAGIISAIWRNSFVDYSVTTVALVGISTPVFWTALILMIFIGVQLDLLPVHGRGETLWGWSILTLDGLKHLIIPAVALSSVLMAMNARLTRATMLEVLRQEYITTARSKGLRENIVILRHAFRNALLPVVTNAGMQFSEVLFAGAVLTETTTAWPGVGRLMFEAIARRDQTVVFGLTFLMAFGFVLLYLVVDILYAYIDPRITYD
ncbi:TPA: ABC transporter permease [Candidatus Poribacteria bacterium]|nr:ABC transporter permease [Candidatus Poribacteria bacterium]